ncbi:MAG: glutaredoxin family protein [Vulcanimicrobiaceae bacterium]
MNPTDIVLYEAKWCPYCRRVREKMAELRLAYTSVDVPRSHSQRHSVKAVSGQTGIPTLVDGNVVIADDDDAIIAYIEQRYGRTVTPA